MTVREAGPRLGKLVEKVQRGAPVILINGNKLAKLERYDLLDPEFDAPELEKLLLEAVEGPHTVLTRKDLDAAAQRARKRLKKR